MRYLPKFLWLLAVGVMLGAFATPGHAGLLYRIDMEYRVQPDSTSDHTVPVDRAELLLEPGQSGAAFLGNMSVKIAAASAGHEQHLVDFTVTSLPPSAQVVSRQILLEEQRPIDILNLRYKRFRRAQIRITVLPVEGEHHCGFGSSDGVRTVEDFISNIPFHGAPSMVDDSTISVDTDTWYADPSAHFELYYIPNTLGDFGWNVVRDYLEKEFKQFDNVFHLNRAQRVNYFIAPCKVPEIAWTRGRNWAVDPTTFKAYAIYNRDQKDVSGIPTNVNYFYRYLGYAPLLVVEGAARGFEYDHYYAKKLKWRGRLPKLADHLSTFSYRQSPDTTLPIAAGSFINYMIGTRGLDKYYRLYGIADDLNLDSAFAVTYGSDFGKLEAEWNHFLDTMRVRPHMAGFFVARAKLLGRNQESIELLKALITVDTADVDRPREDLALLHFLEGEYEEAVETLDALSERRRGIMRVTQMRASALFFMGEVDSARAAYARALADTTDRRGHGSAALMFGWLETAEENYAKADSLFELTRTVSQGSTLDLIEASLHQAEIRRARKEDAIADSLSRQAVGLSLQLLKSREGAADLYMRVGEGYALLGQADTALIYLDVAEFLEYRPYYLGRILIAAGNAYDLLGMRDYAVSYYRRALDEVTSYPVRRKAERYLREPYRAHGT